MCVLMMLMRVCVLMMMMIMMCVLMCIDDMYVYASYYDSIMICCQI